MAPRGLLLTMVAVVLVVTGQGRIELHSFQGNEAATEAFKSGGGVVVTRIPGLGFSFLGKTPHPGPRGMVILPEVGVAPEPYASYAHSVAETGLFAVVAEKATSRHVVSAMRQYPSAKFWTFVGHGKGGEVAADLTALLLPKVQSLVLIGAALPIDLDFQLLNLMVGVVYFGLDTVVTSESVVASFSRMPGDTRVLFLEDLDHYSFADVTCLTGSHSSCNELDYSGLADSDRTAITNLLIHSLSLVHWPSATPRALSFGDNEKLSPGQIDSKPYPGDIRVKFEAVPIPSTNPQRFWWIFTPSEVKGGLVYYGGAAVDTRAYWPMAFEIAARGHLVVIPQQPGRFATDSYTDAEIILGSNLSVFSGVPKGRWALGGHSSGAAATSLYAAKFGDKIYAAVLHAGTWLANMSDSTLPMVQIYGTLDIIGGPAERYRDNELPYVNLAVTKFIPIEHGNHGQVGDYGFQNNDGIATISLEYQQTRTAEETAKFLENVAGDSWAPVSFDNIFSQSHQF